MSENNEKPLVSIITVCYNSEKYIRDTIESVLNQTYDNIEYIIVDGNSTDNTLDIIKEYEPKFNGRMKWISEPDNGIYDAMNKGIDMAKGEIIGIINSDDWYKLETVELVVENFLKSNADLIYGDMYKVDPKLKGNVYFEGNISKAKMPNIRLNHPTIFIKKEIYNTYGKFNTKYIVAADRELIFRLLQNNVSLAKVNSILAYFRLGGTTSNLSLKYNFKRVIQEFEILNKYEVGIFKSLIIAIKQFYRLTRNHFINIVFGNKIYNYLRIKKLQFSNKEDDKDVKSE